MNNEQYLVLLGEVNQVVSVPKFQELEFIRSYVKSGILKYSWQQFSHYKKVLIENPTATEITGVCKRKGQLIRGNAVIALAGETVCDQISGMSKAMAEIALKEVMIITEFKKYQNSFLELGE